LHFLSIGLGPPPYSKYSMKLIIEFCIGFDQKTNNNVNKPEVLVYLVAF
jgi:hypothetical protein